MTFSRKAALRRILSPIALAAVAGAGFAGAHAPAMAQKKEKAAPVSKANYSKEFIAAYKPVETQANAAGADFNTLKASVPALIAAASTPDDKLAAGRMIVNIGQKTKDHAISLQGAELALASGTLDAAQQPVFAFAAAQFAYQVKDWAKARANAETAVRLGYAENDPELFLAETYFVQDDYAGGLRYLNQAIAARKAVGKPIPENWVKRGLATAYNNKLNAEAAQWALMYARDFPSQSSWGDAISIAINTNNYAAPEMLDLLRLARRTNTIRTKPLYLEYIDAADARKLPNEVIAVIDAGTTAKLVDPSTQAVKDARALATARIAADKAELPALLRDAGSANAKLVTVLAAADTLLSYGRTAEAEQMYAKALTMPGVNTGLVLTRLGIAQADQGKWAAAQATFAKVQGARQTIANLWALYAAQKAAPAATAAVTTTG